MFSVRIIIITVITQLSRILFSLPLSLQFKRLEELGYQGFAFTIHGDETLLAYSGPISHCFTSPLISYLRAVIVAGK